MNSGFWPLFRHIQRRDIEMTSPVEMDYHDMLPSVDAGVDAIRDKIAAAEPAQYDGPGVPVTDWTMSFLYHRADQGPTGKDGNVNVRDTEPVTVLALGMRGPYRESRVREGVVQLRAWLIEQSEWEPVPGGVPRAFLYNGPGTPQRDLWSEVHLPIRRVQPFDTQSLNTQPLNTQSLDAQPSNAEPAEDRDAE